MHKRTPISIQLEIVHRYLAGESSEKLATALDMTGAGIRKILKRQGVVLRPAAHEMNPVVTEEMKQKAIKMCETHTIADVAQILGIGTTFIVRALRETRS